MNDTPESLAKIASRFLSFQGLMYDELFVQFEKDYDHPNYDVINDNYEDIDQLNGNYTGFVFQVPTNLSSQCEKLIREIYDARTIDDIDGFYTSEVPKPHINILLHPTCENFEYLNNKIIEVFRWKRDENMVNYLGSPGYWVYKPTSISNLQPVYANYHAYYIFQKKGTVFINERIAVDITPKFIRDRS